MTKLRNIRITRRIAADTPISTVFHHWLRGNIDYAMTMAFWRGQVTVEEVREEAERNLQIAFVQAQEQIRLAAGSHYWR